MERIGITQDEFEAIQKAFLDQVIVASNIFYKSTPDEVENFVKFVERTGPYDVVIDGLNVLNKQKRPRQADVLDRTVKHFHDQGKKVLLLGSKILVRYISNIKRLNPKPVIYMTDTTKADDSFFLYAALQSGKDTLIVSKDKLRDHKYLLDPKLRHLFQRWLKKAQIYDWFYSRYGDFTIGKRHLYNIGPHKDEGGWHLPLNDIDKDSPFGNFTVLCLRDTSIKMTQKTPARNQYSSSESKKYKIYYGKKRQQKKPSSVDLEELMK
ncbi:mitochondrial ribonuclease P protein 3 [Elysia marginata]|uniref:Mitochondrial ribonuclease P protein 3 n=1 Tax=Elysia marginata TaxID=1093978 RepID=A0AAV4JTG5_9GAST|nr:mitochondrial ribonuclease P protein 3 [Elysia marginata]